MIAATGELEASQELSEAARRLSESPGALQLRTLQTLAEVATARNPTLISPSRSSFCRCPGAPEARPDKGLLNAR